MICNDFNICEVTWQKAEHKLRLIRTQVFILEQGVPEDMEWDGMDSDALHFLAESTNGNVVGTARLLANGHIGRMAVSKAWRLHGVGRALLAMVLEVASKKKMLSLHLNAQTSAIGFYEKAGFYTVGAEFLDAGIPHYRMLYSL